MNATAELNQLRERIAQKNHQILELLNQRAVLATRVQEVKDRLGRPTLDPQREEQMLRDLVRANKGPFSDSVIKHLFQQLFRASVGLMEESRDQKLKVRRTEGSSDLVVKLNHDVSIGEQPVLIAGPCAVEDAEQLDQVGSLMAQLGLRLLRGGAFKPRSSPYSFQGLGEPGLQLLRQTADRYGLCVVSEVMDPRQVSLCEQYVDVMQIGCRNMYNYDLLREVGRSNTPVLLKRGLSATIDELLWSAEYIINEGNQRIVLCERGIRTFERATRNTLDISAVPVLKQRSFLPVIVDVTHAAGRPDILTPLGRAALAAGADGLMVETHPAPHLARSDCQQQLDFEQFCSFARDTGFSVPMGRANSEGMYG